MTEKTTEKKTERKGRIMKVDDIKKLIIDKINASDDVAVCRVYETLFGETVSHKTFLSGQAYQGEVIVLG